eukprot:8656544-Alexandrium_andersonii.AAC.1
MPSESADCGLEGYGSRVFTFAIAGPIDPRVCRQILSLHETSGVTHPCGVSGTTFETASRPR